MDVEIVTRTKKVTVLYLKFYQYKSVNQHINTLMCFISPNLSFSSFLKLHFGINYIVFGVILEIIY